MPSAHRYREKEVRLTVFDNEPLARLAEQRLRQEGIPCFIRSLGVGPGAWGTTYNLPHGLYVYQSDEMRAREALDLLPLEMAERERMVRTRVRPSAVASVVVWAIAAALFFGTVAFLLVLLIR